MTNSTTVGAANPRLHAHRAARRDAQQLPSCERVAWAGLCVCGRRGQEVTHRRGQRRLQSLPFAVGLGVSVMQPGSLDRPLLQAVARSGWSGAGAAAC
jgi:hypothetical protein